MISRRFASQMAHETFSAKDEKKISKGKYRRDMELSYISAELDTIDFILNRQINLQFKTADEIIGLLQPLVEEKLKYLRSQLGILVEPRPLEKLIDDYMVAVRANRKQCPNDFEKLLDRVDAAVFTGEHLFDDSNKKAMIDYMKRWTKEIVVYNKVKDYKESKEEVKNDDREN